MLNVQYQNTRDHSCQLTVAEVSNWARVATREVQESLGDMAVGRDVSVAGPTSRASSTELYFSKEAIKYS